MYGHKDDVISNIDYQQKLNVAHIHEHLAQMRMNYDQKALQTLILERKPSSITIEDLVIHNLMKTYTVLTTV